MKLNQQVDPGSNHHSIIGGFSQKAHRCTRRGTWRHYTTLDGLPYNIVTCICTDTDDFLWVGTEGGVCRFDGETFLSLTAFDGLAGNAITAVHYDQDGALWVGTQNGGLSHYDGREFHTFTTRDGLPSNRVWAIHRDSPGLIWIATEGGIATYDGHRFVPSDDELGVGLPAFSICEASDGTLWFGRRGRVSHFDGERSTSLPVGNQPGFDNVLCMAEDPEGALWLGTGDLDGRGSGSILRYNQGAIHDISAREGIAVKSIRCIEISPDGHLWFATMEGSWCYDGKRFELLTAADGLPADCVNAIYCDSRGDLWFGTGHRSTSERGGLSRYSTHGLSYPWMEPSRESVTTRCISKDADGHIWLGTMQGVFVHRDQECLAHIPRVHPLSIVRDRKGGLWLALWSLGIQYYPPEEVRALLEGGKPPSGHFFTEVDGLVSNFPFAIYEDHDGTLWFGMREGVSYYDGERFQAFPLDPEQSTPRVMEIYRDSQGWLWFGTMEGLYRVFEDQITRFTEVDGLPHREVYTIYEDSDGTLWFGTRGGGVVHYDGERFVSITRQDGLSANYVLSICRDRQGILWFGTDGGGVAGYDGVCWTSLDERDGLPGNTTHCVLDEEDRLWIGAERGIAIYERPADTPCVRIVAVTADERHTDLEHLPPLVVGQRLTFECRAIDYKTHPTKRFYRYKLEEYDQDWSDPTCEKMVDYTDLPAGQYRFLVQAIDRDLNYSQPANLRFEVRSDPRDAQLATLQTELQQLQWEVGRKYQFTSIVGRSAPIKEVYRLMEKAIESPLPVLITGETGTGKELIAKAIHYNGPRKAGPFKQLNCGAIPRDLVASTLFGYRRGAYTGALEDRPGVFEEASGGTVLLDEIGEMPEDAQVHLLRVLQEHKTQRLGETRLRQIDVRVIAITNRDLENDVREGRFRQDLFYRLNVFPIPVPPLRTRVDDIPLLMEHFLEKVCRKMDRELDGFGPGVLEMFQQYPWPGNVRELENEISRAVSLVEEGLKLQTYHFSSHLTHGKSLYRDLRAESLNFADRTELFQRRMIEEALRDAAGNRSEAARQLGMHRPNLLRLMKRLGIRSLRDS